MSTKKVRIHDLAKQYGMSGKDLAAKLRDYGFSKAKSHMSALDEFEVMQANGVLEANGLHTTAAEAPKEPEAVDTEALGGGFRRKKKKKPVEATVPPTATEEPAPAVAPEPAAEMVSAPIAPLDPAPAVVETTAPDPAPIHAPAAPTAAPEAPVPEATAPEVTTPVAAESPAAPPLPIGRIARAIAEKQAAADAAARAPKAPEAPAEPAAAVPQPEAEVAQPAAPAAEATQSAAEAAAPAAKATEPAGVQPAGVQPAGVQPAGVQPAGVQPAGETQPAAAPKPEAGAVAKAAATPAAKAAGGKAASPRGKVVGFIDPSSFQSAPDRRRPQSRRLQSRDDVAPDVRPTFGRGPAGVAGRAGGPRGDLTAAQLREREQGRFLRRNRAPGPSGGGRGRGRGGSGRGRGRGRGRMGFQDAVIASPLAGQKLAVEAPVTVVKLAEVLKLKSSVVQKMAMQQEFGMFTLNSVIDEDTAILLAGEYEVELEVRHVVTAEDMHLDEVRSKRSEIEEGELVERAPTVAFLGHVDHGKTTLIDKIRQTSIADGEAGGITQHIAAYQVETSHGHSLTVIDTPGHAAFTSMRARGANAVDVVILVVAGDDGVKPSTEEAVAHARAAGTPIVVAINKKDKPGFNPAQVIQQLMGQELVPEQYGGTTAMFETSGMTGEGIDELLEHVFLMAEAELGLKAHPRGPASGVVLEAEIQQGRGIVAQLLVQDGTLNKGDVILAGQGYGKVKSIQDHNGKTITTAGPSAPVAVTGLDALPGVGDEFFVIDRLAKAKEIAQERERTNRAIALAAASGDSRALDTLLGKTLSNVSIINLIVRCDVQGTVEVLRNEIQNLKHGEVEFKLVHSGVGPITESDAALAITSDATLIAFNVGINGKARQEAKTAKLQILRFNIIYEMLDALRDMMEGALAPDLQEEITGHVEIKRIFKSSRIGSIAGCVVLNGTIARNSHVRLMRDDIVVYHGDLASLKREAEDTREVREGFECGIVLRDFRDIKEGDIIEAYSVREVKRYLNK